jgi:hypothetical protein
VDISGLLIVDELLHVLNSLLGVTWPFSFDWLRGTLEVCVSFGSNFHYWKRQICFIFPNCCLVLIRFSPSDVVIRLDCWSWVLSICLPWLEPVVHW